MSITITNIFASELLGSPRGANAPLSFSSPFPSQGKGDKGGEVDRKEIASSFHRRTHNDTAGRGIKGDGVTFF